MGERAGARVMTALGSSVSLGMKSMDAKPLWARRQCRCASREGTVYGRQRRQTPSREGRVVAMSLTLGLEVLKGCACGWVRAALRGLGTLGLSVG